MAQNFSYVYIGGGVGSSAFGVFGSYDSYGQANSARLAQQYPGNYVVAGGFTPPMFPPTTAPAPTSYTVNAFVALFLGGNQANPCSIFYNSGLWNDISLVNAYILGTPWPSQLVACVVQPGVVVPS